ncbi:NAD-dependent protein deacetylase [Halarchaeum sp. CBA1220]|uniref:SIR2 family NAD-dependent protein deacylase n=1 Tax=Halarchaeum sp. CBA1220 TaxID=1853682 RepID=UPI000F3A96CD|nr:Sir2 family NAD-dependent protein deacetylase [Halarchaeum sp. CBA1220]QLC34275.1 NAD-dependent protein deacetylase [Halarchaeum sp. CBA1220]
MGEGAGRSGRADPEHADAVSRIANSLADADTAVAFTGAGVSTASGVPSFRGDDGVWNAEYDPADFRIERFRADPVGFWKDRLELHETMYGVDAARAEGDGHAGDAEARDAHAVAPNAAHDALATLEDAGVLTAVVTQNVDGLHAAAGTDSLLEIHGNARRSTCVDCGATTPTDAVRERVRDGETPPRCDCGGLLKPDVVLFGERLPPVFDEARRLAREADAFLAAGSSLTVEPAASLPVTAARDGDLHVVNFDETPHDDIAATATRADVTDVLPAVAARVLSHR